MKLQNGKHIINLSIIPGPDDEFGLLETRENYYTGEVYHTESHKGAIKPITDLYLDKRKQYSDMGYEEPPEEIVFAGTFAMNPNMVTMSGVINTHGQQYIATASTRAYNAKL